MQILAYDDVLSIVNENSSVYNPLILKDGQFYDFGTCRPINPKPRQKQLTDDHKKRVRELECVAKNAWEEQQKKKEAEVDGLVKASMAEKEKKRTPETILDQLIAKSVAEISVNSVMGEIKPLLDEYISKTYGILPKSIVVKSQNGDHVVTGHTAPEFDKVLTLVNNKIPVFLCGPAGCGKNVICKQVAEALGLEFFFSNAVTQEYKITGFIDANGHYNETQFYKAFTNGGLFMLDEIDASAPEVLVILNAAIANGYFDFPVGKVTAHKDFRIVAAGNTYGTGADSEYTGRYQLDASSLDRFAILDIDYDGEVEQILAENDRDLVNFIHDIRNAIKIQKMHHTISYRTIDRLNKLKGLMDIREAVKIAVLKGLEDDDIKMIYKNMTTINNPYTKTLSEK